MKNLLIKELRLALPAPAVLFLACSAMLLIPSYPYYVAFFYTTLGIFFCCQFGREHNDVFFTLCLPVRKRDAVRARMLLCVLLEAAQLLLAVPFALLRQRLIAAGNPVGMDANLALFALVLGMFGVFNLVFFPCYYRDVRKVGAPFVKGCIAIAVYMLLAETSVHVIPLFRDRLDTVGGAYLGAKLAALALGLAVYGVLTALAYRRAARNFEQLDL